MFGRLSTREIALLAQRTIEDHVEGCEKKWKEADEKMGKVDSKIDSFMDTQQKFERKVFLGLVAVLLSIIGGILVEAFHFSVSIGTDQALQRVITETTKITPVRPGPPPTIQPPEPSP